MDVLSNQLSWARRTGRTGMLNRLQDRYRLARNVPYGNPYGDPSGFMRSAAARVRNFRSNMFTVNRRRRQPTSGIGVTEQHDARLIYQKRNQPYAQRKRWQNFSKKVLAVSEKDLGSQTVVFNTSVTFNNVTPGNQCVGNAALYGLSSTTSYFNDLNNISGFISGAADTVSTGLAVSSSSKILFQSAVMDLTIRNVSTNNGLADSAARMEVDVYEVLVNHTAEEIGATYRTLIELFDQNQSRTDPIGGGVTTEITQNLRGATPFDLVYVLSRFGVKILSKRKYQISNGDQVTYQVRDPARRSMVYREISNQDGFNKPKASRFIYIVGKLAPGLPLGGVGTPGVYQENLVVGMTRKYMFKVENWSEDRTAYLTA